MSDPDDDADDPPPRLLGRGFWLLLVFSFVCVASGLALAVLGPRLLAPPPAAEGALGKTGPSR